MMDGKGGAELKKVIVIGCPGSGKSTFSRKLSQLTGLSLCHLDMLYWNEDRTTVEKGIFLKRLQSVMETEQWIIDGNYGSTMEMRLKACDTVFFLDYSMELCLEGVKARKGTLRSDIPWVEQEDDEEFLSFIQSFREESRPAIVELLKHFPEKRVIIFYNREDADNYLKSI